MQGEPVIPPPDADDDDDTAWALQTAAVQWNRGQRADAVVWLRRAVDSSIGAGRAERTRELTRLAASVADRLVVEAMAVPDSQAPPQPEEDADVDDLLARPSATPKSSRPRPSLQSLADIPVEFDDDAELIEDEFEDDLADEDVDDDDRAPTLPPRSPSQAAQPRHELSSRDYEDVSESYEDVDSVYEEGSTLSGHGEQGEPQYDEHFEEDDDTAAIVDASELLSERPPSPSTPPGARGTSSKRPSTMSAPPKPGHLSGRFADKSKVGKDTFPGGFVANPPVVPVPARGSDRASAPSGRPPASSAPPASSGRGSASSAPPVSSGRPPASSGRGSASSAPPVSSGRPPASSGRGRTSSAPPVSSGRPPASSGGGAASSAPPVSSGRAPTSSAPPPSSPAPSDRPGSDRPMEPIVTAEELFRQKALENTTKSDRPLTEAKAEAPSAPPLSQPLVDDVSLETVRGFEDLPETAQLVLAKTATLTMLSTEEEVGAFGAALVTRGRVGIMPAIADVASSVAKPGDVVFTRGTLSDGVSLRVVALENQTTVASWSEVVLQAAMADCPWVADELRLVADRFQAQAGAVLGPIGERFDDALRELVLSRLDVKAYAAGEVIVEEGKPVPGLHVVGGGRVEIASATGASSDAGPGDFLFAAQVLGGGRAHATARAGKGGALILFTPRSVAHELLLSVPPLIEVLAG
ncbi:MAG TPA: cyclic nucleotide-binding domain-containing protein [Polyangiaceae bacterium]|nr:cyclic nucleotide-binding domain-containing protein [Polyangiaceae bacterium]